MTGLELEKARYLLGLTLRGLRDPSVLLRIALPVAVWVAGSLLLLDAPLPARDVPTTMGAFYQGLRYFTLDPYWVPDQDTPLAWTLYGWAVAIGAPTITAGALIEGVLKLSRIFERPLARARFLDGHVIIGGFGDHGRAVARVLLEQGISCVAVNRVGVVDATIDLEGHEVPLLVGDLADPEALEAAGLARARAVVFCTGDPLVNLNGAAVARELVAGVLSEAIEEAHVRRQRALWRALARLDPGHASLVDDAHWPHLITLVDDTGAEGTVLDQLVSSEGPPIARFDQFEAAAVTLVDRVEEPLTACFDRGTVRVAILGFGRFGSSIARELLRRWSSGPERRLELTVVDLRARRRACELPEGGGWRVHALVQDVEDWVGQVVEECGCDGPNAKGYATPDFAFLCTSDDGTNLRCASRLRRYVGGVEVALRMLNPPAGLDRGDRGVLACNVIEAFAARFEADVVEPLLLGGADRRSRSARREQGAGDSSS